MKCLIGALFSEKDDSHTKTWMDQPVDLLGKVKGSDRFSAICFKGRLL